jgi:adenylate cyclase
MASVRIAIYRLRVLLNIVLIWVIFAILFLYNIILISRDYVTDRSLIIFSLAFAIIGFTIAAALIFYLKNAFRFFPLWISVLLKMILMFFLFVLIAFIMLSGYYVFADHKGSFGDFLGEFYRDMFLTKAFMIFMFDLGIMTLLTILIIEVTDKYGPGGFWSMMRGKYNKPKIENRIFVFLDINDATTIAEKLGHTKYFRLLRQFFADITIPILANGGEIYQYVGDEVVLSWKNTPYNKIRCLKMIRQAFFILKRKEKRYMKRYGVSPSFKTGIHAGEVTAGVIGIVKKDLVYSGDTLNTTARIRGKCHDLNHSFVLSGDFMDDFHTPHSFQITEIGEMEFKGREEKEKLYSLSFE